MANHVMPSAAEEQHDPAHADAIYSSATKVLIESRRDESHSLLHKENAAYGFRRNLYGLRGAALCLAALLLAGTVGVFLLQHDDLISLRSIVTGLAAQKLWTTAVFLDLAYLAFYAFVVTPEFVFQSGADYAAALLRTLDKSEPPSPVAATP
jgi:hypothetical protein